MYQRPPKYLTKYRYKNTFNISTEMQRKYNGNITRLVSYGVVVVGTVIKVGKP